MPPASPKQENCEEMIRLRARDLRPGMYVCELDRPWLDSPFLLQGFEVKSEADVDAVRRHCQYVYIDLARTRMTRLMLDEVPGSFAHENRSFIGEEDLVGEENLQSLQAAETTHQQTSGLLKTLIDDIRFGQSPDIQLAQSAVSECVSNVLRNPEAMMLLARLRDKDEYSAQNACNVCVYSIVLGRLIRLDGFQLEYLGTCGLLHDIGKVAIPERILNKTGELTPEETAIAQKHTIVGRDILMSAHGVFSGTVDVAYGHHENLDGSGYPCGMQGCQLNLNSKIVSIADKYDAIISPRPYRPCGDHLSAVAILNKLAREHKIDGELTARFVSYLGVYPPGSIVELNSGEVGIVLESNPRQPMRPRLLLVRDVEKAPTQCVIDLAQKTVDGRGRPYRIMSVRRAGDFGIELGHYHDALTQAFSA